MDEHRLILHRRRTRAALPALAIAFAAACGGGSEPAPAASPSPAVAVAPPASVAAAAPGPCTQEVPVPVKAVAFHDVKWSGDGGKGSGNDPQVMLVVPNYGPLCGLRLRFTVTTGDKQPVLVQLFWGKGGIAGDKVQSFTVPPGQEQTVTVNVTDEIDSLRFDPATKPVDFKLPEIVLLTHAGSAPR